MVGDLNDNNLLQNVTNDFREAKMKDIYPIVLKKGSKDNYIVFIPDFNINTEGEDEEI